MSEAALIRPATAADADAIAAIYNHYVHHSIVTFETEPVTAVDMGARLARLAEAGLPWLVAVERGANDADAVVGYAYAGPFAARAAYGWPTKRMGAVSDARCTASSLRGSRRSLPSSHRMPPFTPSSLESRCRMSPPLRCTRRWAWRR